MHTFEWVGMLATAFILIGLNANGEKKIRVFNLIGSVIFIVYGILLGAFSIWSMNIICLGLNLYKLAKLRAK